MGAIKKFVDGIDPATEAGKEQKELLETLAKLAEAKAAYFVLQMEKSLTEAGKGNLTVPIEAILASTVETHAYSSDSATSLVQTVGDSVKNFIGGGANKVVDGVTNLLGTAISAFLGASEGSADQYETYYVMSEGLSIIRFDVKAWRMLIKASGIKTKVQSVSAFVGMKSTVDLARIKFNTFLNVYQRQLQASGLEQKDIGTALTEARKIYEPFQRSVAHQDTLSFSQLPAES